MKQILLLLFVLLSLPGCKPGSDDTDMELIPVKSGEKWGYINHEGKFVLSPQFGYAYIFNEGLALVQDTSAKFGYINKKGEFIIPAIYKDATGFSEGLAIVVRENEQMECIDKKGRHVFSFGRNTEQANSFSEKMAPIVFNDRYGYVNYSGSLAIGNEYSFAADFKDGLARVSVYDSTDQVNKFGFINTMGKPVINFQFEYADDFHSGLALVSAGRKYGYIDRSGKYIINPQFDWASGFEGDYAAVRIGKLYGFINKKGDIIIPLQYSNADGFYPDGRAVAGGENGKLGFIDEKGIFTISPQFDGASRFYGDIAVITMEKKIGFIDKAGKMIVTPQFDAVNVTRDNHHFIHADDADLDGITAYILDGDYPVSFNSFSKAFTYRSLATKFPGLNEKNYDDFAIEDEMGHSQIKLQKITFEFDEGLFRYEGPTTKIFDYFLGIDVTEPVDSNTKASINVDAHLSGASFYYTLKAKAYNKKKEVITAVLRQLRSKYSLADVTPVSQSADNNLYEFKNDRYTVILSTNSKDEHSLKLSVYYKNENNSKYFTDTTKIIHP